MKKIALFCSAALLAIGFAACDDDFNHGIAQVNPQETIMSAGGITVANGAALEGNTLDLNNYVDAQIPVIKLALTDEEAAEIPAGTEINFVMQLATAEDYSDAIEIPVVDGSVPCADWDNYFRSKLGKSPAVKDNYVRFAAYMVNGSQEIRVGDLNTYFAAKKVSVTPIPLDITIEENYYLIGTINGWALDTAYPFNHTGGSVYDQPEFTITVEISEDEAAAGWWWKVAPASAITDSNWDVCVGTVENGDENLSGSIVDSNAQAGCIKEAGTYTMTINMMDMTYRFEKMEYLYTPGGSNGWNQAASQKLTYYADQGKYMGYAYLNGEFKFTSAEDWSGVNYGDSGTPGTLTNDGGAGNLTTEEGLYWCVVDTENLTYTITKITSLGAIGGMNGWGAQEALTPSNNGLTWIGDVTFGAGDEWKFRANDNWDINLGGAESKLVFNGANMVAPGAGTYTITLDLSKLPYTCTLVKK